MKRSNEAAPAALRVRYDAEAGAMYWQLHDGEVARTVEVEEMVYVDVDAEGRPIGVEFVVADDLLPFLARHGGEFVVPSQIGTSTAVSMT